MVAEEEETIEFHTSVIIPDVVTGGESAEEAESSPKSLAQQLEEAKLDAKKSAEALDGLIAGIRAVKRILVTTHSDENKESKEDSISKDEQLIASLSDRLHGVLGSDLMALTNAANMARGHAKLASDEAASLISDMHETKAEAEESNTRARTAEKITRMLYKDNLVLQQQVGHLRKERRTLVRAVRELQHEQEETSRFDSWRLLEEHVQNSVTIHEMILKTPTRGAGKTSFFGAIDPAGESTRTVSDDGFNYISTSASVEKPSKNGRTSPALTASCSEDSMSYKHKGGSVPASGYDDREDACMPTDVSLMKRSPTSPLATPIISPAGNGSESQELKPFCDPNILRTLAIPSGEKGVDGTDMPSPRVRIAPGLYEV